MLILGKLPLVFATVL